MILQHCGIPGVYIRLENVCPWINACTHFFLKEPVYKEPVLNFFLKIRNRVLKFSAHKEELFKRNYAFFDVFRKEIGLNAVE